MRLRSSPTSSWPLGSGRVKTHPSVTDELAAAFHAVDLQTGTEVAYKADQLSVAASVFKLPVLVALVRAADAGVLDLAAPVTVPVEGRAAGPTGLSTMSDPVTMSLRDLARSM